jgi:hypothetical protein
MPDSLTSALSTRERICSVDGCALVSKARGLCSKHWTRWRRASDPTVDTLGKHGQAGTPLYRSWKGMRQRCNAAWQAEHPSYAGVTCDPRWTTFEGFRDNPPTVPDGRPFQPGMCLSRVSDIGPYSPENARWRTRGENSREAWERRMARLPDGRFAGDVAKENGIASSTWEQRVRRGWDIERAVTER